MVLLMWITMVLFSQTDSTQTNIVNQPNSVVSAASGDNVTLHCLRMEEGNTDPIIWYKQATGHEPRVMVTVQKIVKNPIFEDEFQSPRFTVENFREKCNLKISHVEPSDEAVYYCGRKTITITFGKGTFLSVRDDRGVKVSVTQMGVWDSVPAGASVTLQCSVLSESRAAELQVLWFRAAPPQSHPQIIYTHHNSSRQCESGSSTHTCVYNLSKNILSLNDTGTYYCAVVVCGRIILGNGTRVQLESTGESGDLVVIWLAVALAVCVVVISVQVVLFCKWRNHEQHTTERKSPLRQTEKTSMRERDSVELNYAALHFNEKKTKGGKEKRKQPQDSVYSEVRSLTIT